MLGPINTEHLHLCLRLMSIIDSHGTIDIKQQQTSKETITYVKADVQCEWTLMHFHVMGHYAHKSLQ